MFVVFVILLHVSPQVSALEVFEEDQFILLPCQFHTFELTKPTVEWIRQDLSPSTVHQRQSEGDQLSDQNQFYRGRTSMKSDALETGDLSLNLTKLQQSDSGTYTCTIRDFREERTVTDVPLLVKKQFPLWAPVLLVLVLVLVISGGVLYHFRHHFLSGYKIKLEVDSGAESVLLPCKTTVHLPEDAKVEWRDRDRYKVQVYQKNSRGPEKQLRFYKNRTELSEDHLSAGDLSLTLKHPTRPDTDTYTCTVYSRGRVLLKKKVKLQVKVHQVEVESGAESVLLPCETTVLLPEDAKVEWRDSDKRLVHVDLKGSEQQKDQCWVYRGRTKMNEDLLRTGDLSLTLKYPTYRDRDTYTCTVYSSDEDILTVKQVELCVKDCQVEVEEGAESVLLPFRTSLDLQENIRVLWWRYEPGPVMRVCHFLERSVQPVAQNPFYRNRVQMNEDSLRTGDFSLTLSRLTDRDFGRYRCGVWTQRNILMWTTVLLKAKGSGGLLDQTEDNRNRRSSIETMPLMSDQVD